MSIEVYGPLVQIHYDKKKFFQYTVDFYYVLMIFFLIFTQKLALIFHANCLQIFISGQSLFSGKNKKNVSKDCLLKFLSSILLNQSQQLQTTLLNLFLIFSRKWDLTEKIGFDNHVNHLLSRQFVWNDKPYLLVFLLLFKKYLYNILECHLPQIKNRL